MSPALLVTFLCTNARCAASSCSFIWAWCLDVNAQTPSSMQLKYFKASKRYQYLYRSNFHGDWLTESHKQQSELPFPIFSAIFLFSGNDLNTYSLLSKTLSLEAKEECKCHFMLQKWRPGLYKVPLTQCKHSHMLCFSLGFYRTILSSTVKRACVKHATEEVQNKSCLELTWFSSLLLYNWL